MTFSPLAKLPLLPNYPHYSTTTSLPGLIARFLAGWRRVVQGSILSVQSVSLPSPSPSRLDSGPPATVPRPMPFFMLSSGISLTPRCVHLNLSPYSLTLSAPLPYLTPKSLFDTQSLLNILSDCKVVHFQWIPGHSSLPGNDLADSLAKVGASLDPSTISLSLSPLISSQ